MAVHTILKMGNPILKEIAQPITRFNHKDLVQLIEDMFETMAIYNGAGLAAPQIGISLRIVIFGGEVSSRYPESDLITRTVLINPVIEYLGKDMEDGWEGCLSVPGLRGLVPRYLNIRYHGYDQKGNKITREVTGFHARVVQHECDHLDGILYPQRMKDFTHFGFEDELRGNK
ncbi:peptide deformylase [Candidatus Nitrosacidococcus tergens]|uniref:Peptide deformylase n=1 Tax=Candidatus Nitrosacidococcus tergens TaxID=553981 RepID=A0A7G1QAE6_9GAMM|nr:peptide deformylase [Candidatus Nitrosacidococcus tergens]CAB1276422.1 Peptide deformylase 1 [Candidatus Nitrosacidococcus tergens]